MNIRLIKNRIRFDISASEITQRRTLGRIQTMADAIESRFPEVINPEQIKLKHCFYLREQWFESQKLSPSTVSDYTRSMILMITALGRGSHWLAPLKLTKNPSKGGRPLASRVIKSKSRQRQG